MARILVVDDNQEIIDLLENILGKEGFDVIKANSGIEALKIFSDEFSLVILDVMMPEMDGCEVCREIRKISNVPILYLSAKGTDVDQAIGLAAGGDDYIGNPFSSIELVARVKALIRRYTYFENMLLKGNIDNDKKVLKVDNLTVDLDAHKVMKYEEEVKLTKTEYDILVLLICNRGKVFSTEDIFKSVWKEKYYEGNNTVIVHLARLREKIEDNPRDAKIIKNVWGVGYRIEA